MRLGPDEAESGIEDLVEGYRRGEFDVSTVIDDSLARIEVWDRQGPILNAMVTIDSRARQRAEALDQELASTGVARPLHGVPFVVKDNINVAGLPTTGGCAAPPGTCVRRKMRAPSPSSTMRGAVILGKSSMSEFAFGLYDTENSVIEGYTRNPYHLDYASGGSSGGTGVAVAAGYCVAGLGTDTGCSVRSPASVNGVVGLRPTHGLIGYDGVMPLNAEWDTVGPMARSVADVARVLDVIGGDRGRVNYAAGLDGVSLTGTRLGVLRRLAMPGESAVEVVALFERALADFKAASAVVVDPIETDVFSVAFDVADWEARFRHDFDEFLANIGDRAPVHSLAEVAATGLVNPRYADDVLAQLDWPFAPGDHPKRAEMDRIEAQYRAALLGLIQNHALDALVFPTFRFPPVLNGSDPTASEEQIGSNNAYASLVGFPALNVPMGFVEPGLPMGLQLVGRPHSEARLLQIGFGYERRTQHRRPPEW